MSRLLQPAVYSPYESPPSLVDKVDLIRINATRQLDPASRGELGQYLTSSSIASFMASLFALRKRSLSLLDAGAGTGSLTAAFVDHVCGRQRDVERLRVVAYEVDTTMLRHLRETLRLCSEACREAAIDFEAEVREENFIESASEAIRGGLFQNGNRDAFSCAILNPPYRKIHSDAPERHLLRRVGIETSNLYTAFVALAIELLEDRGELVAITPRSFCNGPYFRSFRQFFLERMSVRRIHAFESRREAFRDDDVLQENIIFHAARGERPTARVTISSGRSVDEGQIVSRRVRPTDVVQVGDPESFIHVVTDELNEEIARRVRTLPNTLDDLGLTVSTGRVVDFRARRFLLQGLADGAAPLIYPAHFANGFVSWPRNGKKPNAILRGPETDDLLVPSEAYVLVKRFSAKEERRRVVAAVYDPERLRTEVVAFENHLNYFHQGGSGLPLKLAKGLAVYLNSTLLDTYFRQFNGHTQVNATDLRSLPYPTRSQLDALGANISERVPEQDEVDALFEEVLSLATKKGPDPVRAKRRIEEAEGVLRELGLPREQLNERSALTLLALLDMRGGSSWQAASAPLRGVTQMMEFFREHYGKKYAPNTRETVRRFTLHQFVQAGLVLQNPDKPDRPINSPQWSYQIEPKALELLKRFGTVEWPMALKRYLAQVGSLRRTYAAERALSRIPINVASGKVIQLTPGGQNALVKKIIDDFCPQFTPGGIVAYVGDAGKKWAYLDSDLLKELGVTVEEHGKFPDVVVFMKDRDWLVLIEAVTSHGPINPKRRHELNELFQNARPGLVFVTTFLDKRAMVKYAAEIAWETEVWVAESPGHLIHFNGQRFLGPY